MVIEMAGMLMEGPHMFREFTITRFMYLWVLDSTKNNFNSIIETEWMQIINHLDNSGC
jgi:hypothetical protein